MREFKKKADAPEGTPLVPDKTQFGPFCVDDTNSDDQYLFVDVEGRGTVVIKREDEGLVVDVLPFQVVDTPVASLWAHMNDLFPSDDATITESMKPLRALLNVAECERGNILITHEEEFYLNAWLRLDGKDQWLQVSYRSDNYPALNVSTVTVTEEELAAHIRKEFGGGLWYVRKMNIKGVQIDDHNHVIGDGDADNDEEVSS